MRVAPFLGALAASLAVGGVLGAASGEVRPASPPRASGGSIPVAAAPMWVASASPGVASASPGVASAPTRPRSTSNRIAGSSVSGLLRAPGGPYLRDRFGRAVLLHGVNAVEKNPPYELTVTPGLASSFTATDAGAIAALGFDVVRLGIVWAGLEPGSGGVNNPAVCAAGKPADPHMYRSDTVRSYLAQVHRVVDLLGRFHVYTLLDMHQDVYNEVFRGEGAPAWAVCTDPEPVLAVGGRWSANYGNPALEVAFNHFWTNDVAGDLQGEYDRVWAAVARSFSNDSWIVGYDPYNEPFARVVTFDRSRVFGTLLECFYTGTAHPGRIERADPPLACPPGDPRQGIIPTIEKADPHHLVFVEPDNYSVGGRSSLLGPMPFPRLVLQFHSYCGARSPVTGDPTDLVACADQITDTMLRHNNQRAVMTSVHQPGGPPLFLGEFGATGSTALIDQVTRDANLLDLGWAYWTWKSYADPTGSSNEALMSPGGQLAPTAAVLSRPYAQAVAGTPTSSSFDPPSMRFRLTYVPIRSLAPSVIFVPVSSQYQNGYCASAVGGRIVSERDASHLLVKNLPRARQVTVVVTTGPCGRSE